MNDDFLYFHYDLCRFHALKIKAISRVCREKIIAAFNDIDNDIDREMDRIGVDYPFDPEHDDPGTIWEQEYEKGIDYGMTLSEAKCLFTAFSAIVLYHDWEKSIISFLKKEISRNNPTPNISKWQDIRKWLKK